jgi:hypothetical protein
MRIAVRIGVARRSIGRDRLSHAGREFAYQDLRTNVESALSAGESLAICECYEGCSSGVGLGNCWLPTIGNPDRSPE